MLTEDLWHINKHWANLKLILLIDDVSFYTKRIIILIDVSIVCHF